MIQNRGESARPSVRWRLKVRKLSGSESKLSAFVTMSMIPVKMLEVARVMMKLLIPVRVMRKPLINPRMTASVRLAAIAISGGTPNISIMAPANMATIPPIAPMDRFISPAESASIWAKAIMTCTEANRTRVNRLYSVRKPSARHIKNAQKAIRTRSKPKRDQLRFSVLIIALAPSSIANPKPPRMSFRLHEVAG